MIHPQVVCSIVLLTLSGALALEWPSPLEFRDQYACRHQPQNRVCFFEQPNFQGKCACVGLTPNYEDVLLGNGGGYGSVRLPSHKKLVINVFKDDFIRNTTSIESDVPTEGIARRFVVGVRNTVCLYEQANFHGEKVCLPANAKPYNHPNGFGSMLMFPTQNPNVRVLVQDDVVSCRSESVGMFAEYPNGNRYNVTVSSVNHKQW